MGLLSGFEHFVRENEPMAPHTWLRVGGLAEYFAEPTSVEELAALVQRCREEEVTVRLLGGGSNLLVRDEGAPGVVIHLAAPAFNGIEVEGNIVKAGAGARLSHVISTSIREGLGGFEQLTGIPGVVGGALHSNSSTSGGDIGQWTTAAAVMTRDGEILHRTREELNFAYRHSSLDELVILSAEFELEPGDPQELTKRMQKLWIEKQATQPRSDQNSGCIFKNPGGASAASLIEQAGLKGASMGEAEVSDRDANFIVAGPGATSQDVIRLADLIRNQVADRAGVELELAIEVW